MALGISFIVGGVVISGLIYALAEFGLRHEFFQPRMLRGDPHGVARYYRFAKRAGVVAGVAVAIMGLTAIVLPK